MKRVYTDKYLTRNPRALAGRVIAFARTYSRALLALTASLLAGLLVLSFVMVAAEADVNPPTAVSDFKLAGAAGDTPAMPSINAVAGVLIDAGSGRVLMGKNENQVLPVASTTKIATALAVVGRLDLHDMVTTSREAAAVGEQEIWLDEGEVMSVEDMLYALLVHSANDAAHALAEAAGDSVEGFSVLMNEKARGAGAVNSNFRNPHGLDEQDHHSTALDLALMGAELLKDPVLARIVSTRSYEIEWPGRPFPRTCLNRNEIMGLYEGANGIKTGYTSRAGPCLVASASREGTTLVAVALNSQRRGADVMSMLDYGFAATERVTLVEDGQRLGESRVSAFPRRYVDAASSAAVSALSV